MDLQQLIRVLRVRWKFIVVTLVLGSVLSAAFALTRTPSYESTGRIFIVAPNGSSGDAFPTLLVTQRASSYADLAKDPALLQKVLNRIERPIPLSELASRLSVSVVVDTQIVQVTATGDTPQEAKDIADATVAQLLSLVRHARAPDGRQASGGRRPGGRRPHAQLIAGRAAHGAVPRHRCPAQRDDRIHGRRPQGQVGPHDQGS